MANNDMWEWEGTFQVSAQDDEYVILEPGEYEYTIVNMERLEADGSLSWVKAGTPGTRVTIRIADPNSGQDVTIKDSFWMSKGSQKKLKAFFGSIGRYQKGSTELKISWTNIIGEKGHCEVINKISNDKTYNNIKSYIYKEDVKTPETNNWGTWNG